MTSDAGQAANEGSDETGKALALQLDVDAAKREVETSDDSGADAELERRAEEYATQLIAIDPGAVEPHEGGRAAIEALGRDAQRDAARRSRMLKQPVKDLARHAEEGGPIANALVDLRVQVEALDPNRFDFSPGWRTRLLGMIPGFGTPLKRYFSRYESSQTIIDATIQSLESGREQLKRDNITLGDDQREMRDLTHRLRRQIDLAQALDGKIETKLETEVGDDEPRRAFVQEELLFPLRQRTMDLQQQLAVNQQGVLATEIVVRNNRELIRGVDRAINVTVSALEVAVAVALALANQRIVLDKISAVSRTTSELIAGTAERLRVQGTEIHAQASETMLDMDALRSAFADISAAMDEISRFRREALPTMASTILEFDELTDAAEEAVERMEQAQQARPALQLEAG
jgi:uncharacterized protein YaaN involved in tellurite resistance